MPQPARHHIRKGTAVDVAEADENQPLHLLRADLDKRTQPTADEFQFAQHQPYETAKRSEADVDQRSKPAGQACSIFKLIHAFTRIFAGQKEASPIEAPEYCS